MTEPLSETPSEQTTTTPPLPSSAPPSRPPTLAAELTATVELIAKVKAEVAKVIFGQERVIEEMIVVLLCGGHALLEGVPGTAKTLAVRALAEALSCEAKRIQFTPDLMPSDIIGTNVFDLSQNTFSLRKGPLFTDLLLADEINRSPAKTQSALLEGMSERHATIDGTRYQLSPVFTVFATQNPIEYEGTYPLPEAQQDRFLLKIKVDYPTEATELNLVTAVHEGRPPDALAEGTITPVCSSEDLKAIQHSLVHVTIEPGVMDYLLKIVRATREHDSILVGAGPRGSIALMLTSKARAVLRGHDFVTPDDIVAMVTPVLGHRLTLSAEAEIQGATVAEILTVILDTLDVPR